MKITKPDEAMRRLESALLEGDHLQARAIGAATLDKAMAGGPIGDPWVPAVNRWGSTDPELDKGLGKLSEHLAAKPGIADGIQYSVSLPSEIRESNWEMLAAEAENSNGRADMTPGARKTADDLDTTFHR
jgi:hypothetical protein